jgi:5-methylcytosine-specific restriction protein B
VSLSLLLDIIHSRTLDQWSERNKKAFEGLFGGANGRYQKVAEKAFAVRAPGMNSDTGVPFAAYIHPSNPNSGPYSGLSFVIFPVADSPCLIGLVVGTQGLAPDEAILGRPGHGRKAQAICGWLNEKFGQGDLVAWAKHDPTRTDISMPDLKAWSDYKSVFDRYGKEIYAVYRPRDNRSGTEEALVAFLDLLLEERGYQAMAGSRAIADKVRDAWFQHLLPSVDEEQIIRLLDHRRFVIIQGPPGTGKTYLATGILSREYANNGKTIQFHPNSTYETFIGGLAPVESKEQFGFRFEPRPGFLMEAATEALKEPSRKYLLHIDEINRADLGKILGEAIFLLESTDKSRTITLAYDFGPPFHRQLYLPENLQILGTMNSSDRSIAILDVAVRRRFAFLTLMPQFSVIEKHSCKMMQEAFKELVNIFVEHAPDEAFTLMPGHSYFLQFDESLGKESLIVNLAPLLEEYLAQGYVGGFAEPIRSYLQSISAL